MDTTLKALYFFTDLILPLAAGYLLKKKFKHRNINLDRLITINILFLFPLSGMLSFWILTLNTELIWLPVLGVAMQLVPGLIGFFAARSKYTSPLDRGGYILSNMLSNRGVVGSLTVFIILGEQGYAYCRLTMLFASIIVFMFCFPMAQRYYESHKGRKSSRPSLKALLLNKNQLPTLGIAAGLFLNASGIARPPAFKAAFDISVHTIAWCALLPIGYALDFNKIKGYWRNIFDFALIKFVATPILIFLPAYLLIESRAALATVVILSMSPTAINAVITSKIHRLNIHIATASFITTTLLYILLVFPLILVATTYFLKI